MQKGSPTSGFTLIELMIVTAIIAIIASIAIPNLLSARLNSNEAAAIATLRNIATAQAQFRSSGAVDANNNGSGEFGYFRELAGGAGLRQPSGTAGTDRLSPPILTGAFAGVASTGSITGGVVTRAGYIFQMYLPSATFVGVPEADSGGVGATAPDPTESESLWCCYAWPLTYAGTARRTFMINQTGEVVSTKNIMQRYTNTKPPAYDAAFEISAGRGMASTIATNSSGKDGQLWIVVN